MANLSSCSNSHFGWWWGWWPPLPRWLDFARWLPPPPLLAPECLCLCWCWLRCWLPPPLDERLLSSWVLCSALGSAVPAERGASLPGVDFEVWGDGFALELDRRRDDPCWFCWGDSGHEGLAWLLLLFTRIKIKKTKNTTYIQWTMKDEKECERSIVRIPM